MRNLGQTMERHGYQATFIKVDYYGKFALLYAIMDERHIQICDHVWVRVGESLSELESVKKVGEVELRKVEYDPPEEI